MRKKKVGCCFLIFKHPMPNKKIYTACASVFVAFTSIPIIILQQGHHSHRDKLRPSKISKNSSLQRGLDQTCNSSDA